MENSTRGIGEPSYPFHERTALVTLLEESGFTKKIKVSNSIRKRPLRDCERSEVRRFENDQSLRLPADDKTDRKAETLPPRLGISPLVAIRR